MLRRGLNFIAHKMFDTMIAARLLGIREFSLAALVNRYFGLTLLKGSQKANWAQRPLRTLQEGESEITDRKSTRLNSSHANISYAVFCFKKKMTTDHVLHI